MTFYVQNSQTQRQMKIGEIWQEVYTIMDVIINNVFCGKQGCEIGAITHIKYPYNNHYMKIVLNTSDPIEFANNKNISVILTGTIHNAATILEAYPSATIECAIASIYSTHGFSHAVFMLDGEFAIILYDNPHKQLYCARDAYGSIPLYIIPNVFPSITWEITDKSKYIDQLTIGSYSKFVFDNSTDQWLLEKINVQYHTVPPSNYTDITSLWLISINFIQYLKFAIQKRVFPGITYYINYDPECEAKQFLVAWIMHQFIKTDFYIYTTSSDADIPQHWKEMFGDRIRIYSLANTSICEISTDSAAIEVPEMNNESIDLYDLRIKSQLQDGLCSSHTDCIRPFMDAALIDFYLSTVPLKARMQCELLKHDESLITFLPALLTRI